MNEELAAQYVGLSPSGLRQHAPKPKHVGRRALWDIRDLDRWADALGGQPLTPEQREAEGDEIHRRVMERLVNR